MRDERYLKHWKKLVPSNGILHRVSRDQVTKSKRHQYVVPESLKAFFLSGIHDDAGHQGLFRNLGLARQRIFWLSLDRDVRDYFCNCKWCIVSKMAEPVDRAPLENITSTRPLQLVCIEFRAAEDARNKTVDIIVVTNILQEWPRHSLAKISQRSRWQESFGTSSSVCLGSQNISTVTKEQASRVN